MLGLIHMVFAAAALVSGSIVFCRAKGDRAHRMLGYAYVISLVSVNATALSVYEASSGAGPFHVLAVISLATLVCGFIPVFFRRPIASFLRLHAYFMSWSYVGLLAAGTSQLATMLLTAPGAVTVGLPSLIIVAAGGVVIHSRVPGILLRVRPGSDESGRKAGERAATGGPPPD